MPSSIPVRVQIRRSCRRVVETAAEVAVVQLGRRGELDPRRVGIAEEQAGLRPRGSGVIRHLAGRIHQGQGLGGQGFRGIRCTCDQMQRGGVDRREVRPGSVGDLLVRERSGFRQESPVPARGAEGPVLQDARPQRGGVFGVHVDETELGEATLRLRGRARARQRQDGAIGKVAVLGVLLQSPVRHVVGGQELPSPLLLPHHVQPCGGRERTGLVPRGTVHCGHAPNGTASATPGPTAATLSPTPGGQRSDRAARSWRRVGDDKRCAPRSPECRCRCRWSMEFPTVVGVQQPRPRTTS